MEDLTGKKFNRLTVLGWSVEKTLTTPVRGTKVKCND